MRMDAILHAAVRRSIGDGSAEILERGRGGLFLRDRRSGAYMLAARDEALGTQWLRRHEGTGYRLLTVCTAPLRDYARRRYGLDSTNCLQAAYRRPEVPARETALRLRPAAAGDFPFVERHYGMLGACELRRTIEDGRLWIGEEEGAAVGFIGEHLEGSIGMLFVLPAHRGKGYAADLERAMIARQLRRGLEPFCQVIEGNAASAALQRKLGLTFSSGRIYWLY